jgi:glycerol-3-phosphate dehydrogenase (NAD(P)+)
LDVNTKIGVVGAGSWGTVLSNLLCQKGFTVNLWAYEREVKEQIQNYRENKYFLPGITLSPNIVPSNELEEVVAGRDFLVVVVPSHVLRMVARKMAGFVNKETIIISASKGIENKTCLTMSAVLQKTFPHVAAKNFVALSGPSFAREVAAKAPTAVTVASKELEVARLVQYVFATPYFRVYTHDDVIGVELGGAVKNVIAIAAGIIDGLGLGLNTRAALITRGLAEIRRLGLKLGANPLTFAGLAGVGDLVLTCTGDLSRNYTVGKMIGEGKKLKEILSEMRMVAEGVKTAKSVYSLSRKLGVEMPICHQIYYILYRNLSPQKALQRLMERDLKQEVGAY